MKHVKMLYLLFAFLISSELQLIAQNDVKKFQIRSVASVLGGQTFNSNGIFELSQNLIRLNQKSGLIKYDFMIRNSFPRPEDSGTDYEISFRGISGMIRWNESSFTIELNNDGEQILPYQFFVEPIN